MAESSFVYVTYIRTTAERLWKALLDPKFTRLFWAETWQDCEWEKGAAWKLIIPDGTVADSGEVLEIDPPRKLVLKWRNEFRPELNLEGDSRMTYELEEKNDAVKLTVTHQIDRPDSKLIQAVSGGWPLILASLKSLMETGEPLDATRKWQFGK
jgi:uncharacterized protein YndB with AHSA1/START domain